MHEPNEINWFYDFDEATESAEKSGKPMLIVFYGEECMGCLSLFRETLRWSKVKEAINASFTPLLVKTGSNSSIVFRYGVDITPSFIAATPDGRDLFRWSGFLPEEDFLGYLDMAVAVVAFKKGDMAAAERLFDNVLYRHPVSFVAPRAAFYLGVSKYKATGNPIWLIKAYQYLKQAFPASVWTVKAEGWIDRDASGADKAA